MLYKNPGMVPLEGLENLVGQIQELDMDEVRQEIAKQDAEKE